MQTIHLTAILTIVLVHEAFAIRHTSTTAAQDATHARRDRPWWKARTKHRVRGL